MSTDLFGEPELDTDADTGPGTDFAWDQFLPDNEDLDAGVREIDESQLELDDSEFAWDEALDAQDPEIAAQERAEAARIEAAFARMEDTVRRTLDPDLDPADLDLADLDPADLDLADLDSAGLDEELELAGIDDEELELAGIDDEELELAVIDDEKLAVEPELILLDDSAAGSPSEPDLRPDDTETVVAGANPGVDVEAAVDVHEPELLVTDGLDEPSFGEVDTEPLLPPGPEVWAGADLPTAQQETAHYGEDFDEDFDEEAASEVEPEPVPASARDLGAGLAPFAWPADDLDDPDEAWAWSHTEVASTLDTAPVAGADPGLRPPNAQPADAGPEAGTDAGAEAGPEAGTQADGDEPSRPTRSRVRVAILALACAVVLLGAGLGVSRALRHGTTPSSPAHAARPASTGQPHTTAPAASAALAAARLQTATDEADSATTTAIAGLSGLSGFPTPTNVAAVVNPYVASLLLYQAYLSGAAVPTSARQATAAASDQIRNDLTFLDTINGLPSIQLGSFIDQFRSDTQQLQATLGTIEHDLSATGHS